MLALLRKILAPWKFKPSEERTQAPLFPGSAYFSNRVPRSIIDTWVVHGGEVSLGTTWDPRARYFFAMDPCEQWVTKLFAKSVTVIHAGWIIHCVDESFRVPIAQYVLDDKFLPGPPYKLTSCVPQIYPPIILEPEPGDPANPGYDEDERTSTSLTSSSGGRSSDTPSTPPKVLLKRKREQAYYDSPSCSLVFSGFDKDGIPRRPRKQRKLRFDPSFSPQNGKCGHQGDLKERRKNSVDWVNDFLQRFEEDEEESFTWETRQQSVALRCLEGGDLTQCPDTPNKPVCYNENPTDLRSSVMAETGPKLSFSPLHVTLARPVGIHVNHIPDKFPPVATIDFTNPPPPTRRFRFPDSTPSATMFQSSISAVTIKTEPVDEKPEVKTPKKISFAEHAQIRVYTTSPPPPPEFDVKVNVKEIDEDGNLNLVNGPGGEKVGMATKVGFAACAQLRVYAMDDTRPSLVSNKFVGPCTMGATRTITDGGIKTQTLDAAVGGSGSSTRMSRPGMITLESEDSESTLTLTYEDVQAMRERLVRMLGENGVGNGRLTMMFEIGTMFQGMPFRHVR